MTKLHPNPKGKYIVGVDIGGTFIKAALLDRQGHIVAVTRRPAHAERGVDATLSMVVEAAREAMAEGKAAADQVCGLGMGVPGRHQSEEGICIYSPNFMGWTNVQLLQPVEEQLGVAAFMRNDVKTATLGEHRFGAGRGFRHVVMITLGTGIGGGAIIDGELRLGSSEGFSEVGHMTVDPHGRQCGCGNHGCWEAMAARDAIIERAVRAIQTGRATALAAHGQNLSAITPAVIYEAAQKGDAVAREVLEETGMYLGIGVANLIQLYNPEVFIIGGGIAQAGELLFDPLRRTVNARAQMVPASTCQIVPAALGDDAGVIGASVLVLERLQAKG